VTFPAQPSLLPMTAESVLNHLIRSTMATFHAAIVATHF
jgi:hypothetical protein